MGTPAAGTHRERLSSEYREAFGKWAAQVHKARQVNDLDPNESQLQVASAFKAYRCARNRLADHLAANSE